MAEMKRVGDLEVAQDLKAQRRNWAFAAVGSAVMVMVALAGLLGLFGGAGPLSRATLGDQNDTLYIQEYERFLRFGKPTTLHLSLDTAEAFEGGKIRLWINREYLKSIQLQEVDPQPDTIEVTPERLIYIFNAKEGSEDRPTEVTFELEPDEMGTLAGRVGLDGGASQSFEQFVYP
jgi:hypothetical protein